MAQLKKKLDCDTTAQIFILIVSGKNPKNQENFPKHFFSFTAMNESIT